MPCALRKMLAARHCLDILASTHMAHSAHQGAEHEVLLRRVLTPSLCVHGQSKPKPDQGIPGEVAIGAPEISPVAGMCRDVCMRVHVQRRVCLCVSGYRMHGCMHIFIHVHTHTNTCMHAHTHRIRFSSSLPHAISPLMDACGVRAIDPSRTPRAYTCCVCFAIDQSLLFYVVVISYAHWLHKTT